MKLSSGCSQLKLGEPRVQAQAEQEIVGLRQVCGELLIEQPQLLEPFDAFSGAGLRELLLQRERAHPVHHGEDAAFLQVELIPVLAALDDDAGEDAERHIEALDRLGEARAERLVRGGQLDQPGLCRLDQARIAGCRRGIVEDRHVHQRLLVRRGDPGADLLAPGRERAPPGGVAHHDAAWTGRIADGEQTVGEFLRDPVQALAFEAVAQDQPVVLIGAQDLVGAALAAHHDQAGIGDQFGRRHHAVQLGGDAAAQLGHQLRDVGDLGAVAVQHLDQFGQLGARPVQILDRARARDLHRDDMRLAGHEAQQIDLLQHADDLTWSTTTSRRMPCLVMRSSASTSRSSASTVIGS